MARIKIDMTGVESFVKADEGQHIAQLKTLDEKVASTGADMLVAVFEVIKGTSKGARIYHNFVLSEKALWNLKGFLEVIGHPAEGRIVIDPDKLVGRVCIIDVIHEEYNGTMRANIDSFKRLETQEEFEDDDFEDDDFEEVEAPKKKKKAPAKKKKKPEPEDEEEWDDDWDDDFEDEE